MSLPAFTPTTTAEEVAAAFAEQIRGRNVLITGTSIDGIGFEAARVLARYANLIEALRGGHQKRNAKCQLILDLSSLAAVRKAAAEVNAYPEPLHILIHNAAAISAIMTNSNKKEDVQTALMGIGMMRLEGLPNHESTPGKNLGQGAATTIAAAFDTRPESKSGAYLVDSVEANDKIAPHCSDPQETAAKL
ncbi:hypothetical protein C8R45DRAFT_1193228 [Mycena sanguinolenta]|nr:hypothetical protein C8R45DRAFT_1193228 [Mycena sanguinolenta]